MFGCFFLLIFCGLCVGTFAHKKTYVTDNHIVVSHTYITIPQQLTHKTYKYILLHVINRAVYVNIFSFHENEFKIYLYFTMCSW